ncbi:glutathione S-transferase T3-like [Arachis duranensis]|uniref:Glutathione S-transferase T3-like n=1 Tax=Arachis duranensis TaxID=130453 RepID=A0A6P4DQY9_ARADU|nr:glutathione S-transferase T3-like [Arachis duranensis]
MVVEVHDVVPLKRKFSKHDEKTTSGSSNPPGSCQPARNPPPNPMQGATQKNATRLANFMKFVSTSGFKLFGYILSCVTELRVIQTLSISISLNRRRYVVACKKQWYKINKAVAQFAGCYDQASRNIKSGSNADDIKELAYKIYSTNYGKKFTFERHWNMLQLEQKWRNQLPTQSGGSKRTKVSATGAYSSSSNLETPLADEPGVDSPVCPQGSKKSKRKGKEKAQMSEDFSKKKSSVIKKLSLMKDIKNVREKELMDREKEREEEREHRAKIIEIKEKELQI